MNSEEQRKKKRRTPYIFYSLLLAAALVTAVSTLSQAANFVNTDGYINLSSSCTNLTNGTCVINYNTTRYAGPNTDGILNNTDWLRFNSSTSSNSSDGNNYTTAQSFERSSNNIILQTARNGIGNISAFFTLQSSTGLLLSNGVYYANATNCSSGQYSRYENNGWNCYNDASGGSGTVTSITINSTTPAVSIVNPTVTTTGTVVVDISNATTLKDGLMTAVQATSLSLKALAGNCAGYNTTHVNVTMNTTTAGPQCVAVALNPGSVDLSGYVPYTGATSNVTLGSYGLKTHSIGPDASDGLIITAANSITVASFGVGNTNNSLFYGSVSLFNGQNLCLSGECRSTWPNTTGLYNNITDLQTSNTSTNTRVNTINTTVQDLINSNGSTQTRINTVNTTVQNLLTSNSSINTRADSINASITTLSTFTQTKAATGYTGDCPTGIAGITINNGSAPNKTCAPAQTSGGSGMTSFGIKSGANNATISNSTTFNLYGSGVSINISSSGADAGATITVSAGGGNISGGSTNGTFGFVPVWNSTNTITNSSLYVYANGNILAPRNILLNDYGSDGSILFNNGLAGGVYWVRGSDRIRYACNAAGTGLCELYGSGIYFAGTNDATLDMYSDSTDRNIYVSNAGTKGANLLVDNNITSNDKIKADRYEFNVSQAANNALFSNRSKAVSNDTVVLSVKNSSMPMMTVEYGTNTRKQYTLMPSFGPFTNMIMWQPGGISSTTIPVVIGTAAAATTNTGTITNTISNFTGPLWGSTTTTTYRSQAHVTWTPLMLYSSAGIYCEGTIIPGGSASYANHDIFAGVTAGTNGTSPLWAGTYTDTASIGILLAQNATTGSGPAFHIYAANTAARTIVNTTINITAGNIYKYSFYKPADENMTYYTLTDQNRSSTFTGNISTSLPNAGTAMRPAISILNRAATAAILRSTGQMCMSWPTIR